MMKKLLALLLSVAMILSVGLTPCLAAEADAAAEKEPVQFADLADDHWAKEAIDRWSRYGIVNGEPSGNVNPDQLLRRCEMAQVLVNLLGLTQEAENTFGDLTGKEWYAGTILKCAAAGIMEGDGVNCNAEAPVTRQEAIVMFGRAMGVRPVSDPDLSKFDDAADVADWAAPYMAPLTEMGILSGVGDGSNVAPKDGMDRASAFSLLDKAIGVYANEPGEYTVDDANAFVVVNSAALETGAVVISGEAAGVVVSEGTTDAVAVKDLVADTVKVDAPVDVTMEGEDTVLDAVQLNDAANVDVAQGVQVNTLEVNAPATVTNKGTVDNLIANAPVEVDNQGTVKNLEVNASDVVVDGQAPETMDVAEGVAAPTNSQGEIVVPSGESDGSSSDSSSNASSSGSSTGSIAGGSASTSTKYTVTVDDSVVGGKVTASPESASAGTAITVTATPDDGYQIGDVTYTVGNDTSVIEMTDGQGSFAMPEGDVTVSATFQAVTVAVESVTLDKTDATIYTIADDAAHPNTVTLTATVAPGNATDKSVTWVSSDGSVATVSDGTVTGLKAGTVTITATAGGKEAACQVTVIEYADKRDVLAAAVNAFVTKYYNKTAGTVYVDVAYNAQYPRDWSANNITPEYVVENDTTPYFIEICDATGDAELTLNGTQVNTSFAYSSVGNSAVLYSMPYRVVDGKLSVNALLLASSVQPDGTVAVKVTSGESVLVDATWKLYNFPEDNNLFVTSVTSVLADGGVTFTATDSGKNFSGNQTDGYTVTGTYASGKNQSVLLGVDLSTTENGEALTDSASGPIIIWDKARTNYYSLSVTQLGETLSGTAYSYGIYPVWSSTEASNKTLLIPNTGFVTIQFAFTEAGETAAE